MNAIARSVDRISKRANRLIGINATFTKRGPAVLDVETGNQTFTSSTCNIKVRSKPLSIRDRIEIASSGLSHIDAMWIIRVNDVPVIDPNDWLTVNGLTYEVVSDGIKKDEFDIEQFVATRRRR